MIITVDLSPKQLRNLCEALIYAIDTEKDAIRCHDDCPGFEDSVVSMQHTIAAWEEVHRVFAAYLPRKEL